MSFSTTVRDWSGWLATLASVCWNVKQFVDLKKARSEATQARMLLHDQRVLQLAASLTNSVSKLTYLLEDAGRNVIRQECQQLAGDLAHFQNYGKQSLSRLRWTEFPEIYQEIRNILQSLASREDEQLTEAETSAIRAFVHAAVVTTRAFQGLLELDQDLRSKDFYELAENSDAKTQS